MSHIRDVGASAKPRCRPNADDEGENDRGLTATDTKSSSLNQASTVLSDRVPATHFTPSVARRVSPPVRMQPMAWIAPAVSLSDGPNQGRHPGVASQAWRGVPLS